MNVIVFCDLSADVTNNSQCVDVECACVIEDDGPREPPDEPLTRCFTCNPDLNDDDALDFL